MRSRCRAARCVRLAGSNKQAILVLLQARDVELLGTIPSGDGGTMRKLIVDLVFIAVLSLLNIGRELLRPPLLLVRSDNEDEDH
jgi:hypothetical protein